MPALSGVEMNIEQGDFVFLVGDSGAGKTSLIRLLFREVMPTSGKVYYHGRDTSRFRPKELLRYRRNIGVVFQDFRLLSRKTVFENVAFTLEVMGRSREEINQKVPRVLEQVGLSQYSRVYPSRLSGGEQQRVGIARAIVKDPLLILADEPTGNVDPNNARQIMEMFKEINQSGTTLVVATHAWELVEEMSQRVVSLKDGRVVNDSKMRGALHVY